MSQSMKFRKCQKS